MSAAAPTPREAELLAQLAARDGRLEELGRENALLRQKVAARIHRLFGVRSERLEPGQLLLLLAGGEDAAPPLAAAVPAPVPPRSCPCAAPARRERRLRLPEHLPLVEEVLDPEPVRACPSAWRCIGQEVNETLDYEPARFLRRRLIRRRFVARHGGAEASPLIAPLPPGLLERGLPTAGLLAQVLVTKFADHLPLYRQEAIYRQRHGVHLPRQTLARWVKLAADWLRPVYDAIRVGVLADGYVQVDETPVAYLAPGAGRTAQGYLWTYARPGGDVLFDWQTGRGSACLEKIVPADFSGTLQCDGYGAYPTFARRRAAGKITLAGGWAHVRRKFHEACAQLPRTVAWLLGQIGQLYRVERRLRQSRAGPRLRAAIRAAESRPVQQRLHRALVRLKTVRRALPQSLLGRAIDYALGQWPTLGAWLVDGRVEIDNNGVENAIRPTAVGKKNWLFVGAAGAGQRGAVIYSVIESCRRRGLDPHAYLRDVLTRLPSMTNWQVKDVTPAAWAKSPRQAVPVVVS